MKVSILLPEGTNVLSITIVYDGKFPSQNVSVNAWGSSDVKDGAVLCPRCLELEEEDHDVS